MRFFLVLAVVFVFSGCSKKEEEVFERLPLVAGYKGHKVFFEAEPWPVMPMKKTIFRIRVSPPLGIDRLKMELSMPGMFMGHNMVVLKRTSEGLYEGAGFVVRCPSGRRLWRATVSAEGFGPVVFDFHVRK